MAHREMLLRVQIGAQGVYIENGACGGAYLDIPPESVPQITAMAATQPCRREPSDGEPGLLVTCFIEASELPFEPCYDFIPAESLWQLPMCYSRYGDAPLA